MNWRSTTEALPDGVFKHTIAPVDPLQPSPSLLCKLATICNHVGELYLLEPMFEDPEIVAWVKAMEESGLIPKKREGEQSASEISGRQKARSSVAQRDREDADFQMKLRELQADPRTGMTELQAGSASPEKRLTFAKCPTCHDAVMDETLDPETREVIFASISCPKCGRRTGNMPSTAMACAQWTALIAGKELPYRLVDPDPREEIRKHPAGDVVPNLEEVEREFNLGPRDHVLRFPPELAAAVFKIGERPIECPVCQSTRINEIRRSNEEQGYPLITASVSCECDFNTGEMPNKVLAVQRWNEMMREKGYVHSSRRQATFPDAK